MLWRVQACCKPLYLRLLQPHISLCRAGQYNRLLWLSHCICNDHTQEAGREGGTVHQWEGAIMSVYSRHLADWDGSGYGPVVATPSVRFKIRVVFHL